jgi:hypothetical protein
MKRRIILACLAALFARPLLCQVRIPDFIYPFGGEGFYYVGLDGRLYECGEEGKTYRDITGHSSTSTMTATCARITRPGRRPTSWSSPATITSCSRPGNSSSSRAAIASGISRRSPFLMATAIKSEEPAFAARMKGEFRLLR